MKVSNAVCIASGKVRQVRGLHWKENVPYWEQPEVDRTRWILRVTGGVDSAKRKITRTRDFVRAERKTVR